LALLSKRLLRRGGIELMVAARAIDRRSSLAFSPTDASFAVYVRDGGAEQLDRVRAALLDLRLDDGRPAVDDVWTPEELYGRTTESWSPALVFAPALGVRPSAAIKDMVVGPPRAPGRGCHQRDGIVMLAGPDVAATDLGRASIYDVAPTMLWAMDAGIPSDGDGRVLAEAFEQSFVAGRPPRHVDPLPVDGDRRSHADRPGEVARRLKALGYI
jgi:hypothetical protein